MTKFNPRKDCKSSISGNCMKLLHVKDECTDICVEILYGKITPTKFGNKETD